MALQAGQFKPYFRKKQNPCSPIQLTGLAPYKFPLQKCNASSGFFKGKISWQHSKYCKSFNRSIQLPRKIFYTIVLMKMLRAYGNYAGA